MADKTITKEELQKLQDTFLRASDDLVNAALNLTVATPSRVSRDSLAVETAVTVYRVAMMTYFTAKITYEREQGS